MFILFNTDQKLHFPIKNTNNGLSRSTPEYMDGSTGQYRTCEDKLRSEHQQKYEKQLHECNSAWEFASTANDVRSSVCPILSISESRKPKKMQR